MRRSHQQQPHPSHPASASAAAPIIDNTQLPKPVLLKIDEEGSIGVKISGFPRPVVRWQVGRKRIKESSKYQLKSSDNDPSGPFVVHSLVIAKVTTDLDQGVWVIATNQHGEDCCLIDVKTYNIMIGQRGNNVDSSVDKNDLSGDDTKKKVGKKKRRGSSHDTQSIVSLDTYQSEMAHRKRMRSADVLNNSIDAQSSYSEGLANHRSTNGGGALGGGGSSRGAPPPPRGSTRISRRDQVPTDLQHKRYSSTEAVHNELRSGSIPPLSIDEQAFASASSIPGTPYEERHMPNLPGGGSSASDQTSEKATKGKKSRRTRSASLTNQSQDDIDGDESRPRRKKVPRVPKKDPASTATVTNLDDPENLKPPLPPSAVAKKAPTENQAPPEAVVETKPRKKKTKTRSTSKSSIASANDTLDKSLEDLDRPTESPTATVDHQEATESVTVIDGETTFLDGPTSTQVEGDEPPKAAKKPKKKKKKRTTSRSSANDTLDMSLDGSLDNALEDWNKPTECPSVADDQPLETQPLETLETPPPSSETTEPVKLNLTSNTKEDALTRVIVDSKTDILTADDNNKNDLWDLFGMKLNSLCLYLLNGKNSPSLPGLTKLKNLTNTETEKGLEFIDKESIALVEIDVEKPSPVTNGIPRDLKMNGLILTSDDSREDKVPEVTNTDLLGVEIKPPTGKKEKKKKEPNSLQKENPDQAEERNREYRLAMNRTVESSVDDFDGRPEILNGKTEETELETDTSSNAKNQNQEKILVPESIENRESSNSAINDNVQLKGCEMDGNAPALHFEYDIDESEPESPTIEAPPIDLLTFDDDRLRVNSWERKEFEDALPLKFPPPPFRISLKPARSEESLAMRPRSETDAGGGYGRRRDLLMAPGRLRVARSVDRLTADEEQRGSGVPLIKRRSLSQEWRIVTVTTKTEEIVVVQKGDNDTNHVDLEPAEVTDIEPTRVTVIEPAEVTVVEHTKVTDVDPARIPDVEGSHTKGVGPKRSEIKYIDSEDSLDMDDDFTWPSPPPMPDNEMPPLTREYAVKQINADVRLVLPMGINSTTNSKVNELPVIRSAAPRIESTIRNRIEMLSRFGYDKKLKPSDIRPASTSPDSKPSPYIRPASTSPETRPAASSPKTKTLPSPPTKASSPVIKAASPPETKAASSPETKAASSQTQSTVTVEPPTPDIPPPLNLNSFPEFTSVHSLRISTADVVLQPYSIVENLPKTVNTLYTKYTSVFGEDEVFRDKGENGERTKVKTEILYDTPSVIGQDMSTQTDQTDNSAPPKIVIPQPVVPTKAIVVENTEKSRFELVADSCRLVEKREERREEGVEPQNTYYVVDHDNCISPVIIHEYGEMLSFCKKQRSLSDAELNIQKTQQQKLEIQLRLQSLWSSGPQRTTQSADVLKSHESLLSDALNAHLANISAAASSRLAETRATYLLETFRTSPTKDQLSSAGSTNLGSYSRRPFSDSTL